MDGFVNGGGVRDGEGRAVAENQVGVVVEEGDLPVDRDVVAHNVPGCLAGSAVFDPGFGGVRDDGVVGADLPVAVRVDVGHEVRAERLAGEDGGSDRALVDGRTVGK